MIVDKHLTYKTIKHPRYQRKKILNVAIGFIELIQQQKTIKEIRTQKHKVMLMLKEEVKKTHDLITNFENILPQAKLKKEIKQIKITTKKQKRVMTTEEPSRMDALHQELFDLKSKLDSI